MKVHFVIFLSLLVSSLSAQQQSDNCLHFNGGQHAFALVPCTGTKGDFTVEMRFKSQNDPNTPGLQRILCWNAPPDYRLEFGLVAGKLTVFEYTPGKGSQLIKSGYTITDGNWHQLAYVREGAKAFWYLDGEGIDIRDSDTRPGKELIMGSWYRDQEAWTGCIDEVRLWNSARKPEQIRQYFDKSLGDAASSPELCAYYAFNQGVGGGNNASIALLDDITGHFPARLFHFALNGQKSNFIAVDQQFPNPPSLNQAAQSPGTEMSRGVDNTLTGNVQASGYRIPAAVLHDVFFDLPAAASLDDLVQFFKNGQQAQNYDTRPRVFDHVGQRATVVDSFLVRDNSSLFPSELLKGKSFAVIKSAESSDGNRLDWNEIEWRFAFADQAKTERAALAMLSSLADHSEMSAASMPTLETYFYQYVLKQQANARYFIGITYSTSKSPTHYIQVELTKADN